MTGTVFCVVEKNLAAKRKKTTTTMAIIKHQLLQISEIMWSMCWGSAPGIAARPSLTSRSSLKSGTLHCSSKGGVEYLIFLIILVVKEPLSTLLSKANLVRVLPISVLLSSWTRLARYLTLLLVQVLKVSRNLIRRLHSMVLGWLLQETASIS